MYSCHPFLSGNAWAALADRTHAHRAILLTTFYANMVARSSLSLTSSFSLLMLLVVLADGCNSAATIIADVVVGTATAKVGTVGEQVMCRAIHRGATRNVYPVFGNCERTI